MRTEPRSATLPHRSPRGIFTLWRGDRGSATAETAIVLPTVVFMLLVIFCAGIVVTAQISAESAARTAARELARGEDPQQATAAAHRVAGPDAQVTLTRSDQWATVTVTSTVTGPRGLLAGARITVRGQATARLEPQLISATGSPAHTAAPLLALLPVAPRASPRRARPRQRRVAPGRRVDALRQLTLHPWRPTHPSRQHTGSRRSVLSRFLFSSRALAGENGSAPAGVLAWVGATVVLLGALLLLGAGAAAQARADTSADLAALAAADAAATASAPPCQAAQETAARNDAVVTDCRIEGLEVVIHTEVTGPSVLPPLRGAARAGPGPVHEGPLPEEPRPDEP